MKDRSLLMIPGPIEFEPAVLGALGAPTASHVAPDFIEAFGQSIEAMRQVWQCSGGQPFIIAGSGTLAMEIPAANLVEPGDSALVISTGYFGSRYAEILKRYGAEVTVIQAPLGEIPTLDQIESQLKNNNYKLMTFTHVDTSTALRIDPESMGQLGQKYGVLTILDGVCSIGGEELFQEAWGIDVALTASQKAIGVPPGLALMVVSQNALDTWRKRDRSVANYYADWNNWFPIMDAYEARKPSYFATPPVNLICALHTSLNQILVEGMDARFKRHRNIDAACKNAINALKLKQVPVNTKNAASTLTAPYFPEGIDGSKFLAKAKEYGIILAGGLHPDIKSQYFRIGHMGAVKPGDILAVTGAIEKALAYCGYPVVPGTAVAAAQEKL